MAFKGVTFAGQNVTPKNDGGLYQAHYGDGILWGCSMAISGDDLVIQSGEFIAGGRVCFVDGATNVDLSGRVNQTGYIQVIMNYDLSQGEGSQWYTSFVESATTTFPALTQDDINDNGNLYQFELAIVQISGGNLTALYRTPQFSGVVLTPSVSTRHGRFGFWGENLYAYTYDSSGNPLAGMRTSDTDNAIIFAPSQTVIIRPRGATDSTNQTKFNTGGDVEFSGQIVGGHKYEVKYLPSTVSISANTATSLMAWGGLDASGIYLLIGSASFSPNSNSGGVAQFAINDSVSLGSVGRDSRYFYQTGQRRMVTSRLFTGGTTAYFVFYSTVAGSVDTNTNLAYIRLA